MAWISLVHSKANALILYTIFFLWKVELGSRAGALRQMLLDLLEDPHEIRRICIMGRNCTLRKGNDYMECSVPLEKQIAEGKLRKGFFLLDFSIKMVWCTSKFVNIDFYSVWSFAICRRGGRNWDAAGKLSSEVISWSISSACEACLVYVVHWYHKFLCFLHIILDSFT